MDPGADQIWLYFYLLKQLLKKNQSRFIIQVIKMSRRYENERYFCASQFRRVGIVGETGITGTTFGSDRDHVRICIGSDRSTFDLTLRRIRSFVEGETTERNWKCSACQDHHVKVDDRRRPRQ